MNAGFTVIVLLAFVGAVVVVTVVATMLEQVALEQLEARRRRRAMPRARARRHT